MCCCYLMILCVGCMCDSVHMKCIFYASQHCIHTGIFLWGYFRNWLYFYFKGVVRSKIGFFKNWICESRRPGRDIAFYPNKIRQKLAENQRVKHENFAFFESTTSPPASLLQQHGITDDVALPRIKVYIPRAHAGMCVGEINKINASL